jgi:hypothetical protein
VLLLQKEKAAELIMIAIGVKEGEFYHSKMMQMQKEVNDSKLISAKYNILYDAFIVHSRAGSRMPSYLELK